LKPIDVPLSVLGIVIEGPLKENNTFEVVQVKPSLFKVVFSVLKFGKYLIHISLDNKKLDDSPLEFLCEPINILKNIENLGLFYLLGFFFNYYL
jgi:hypothetical protein